MQDQENKKVIPIHRLVVGPAESGNRLPEQYEPVSCDFSDQLEDFSVRRLPVDLSYWVGPGEERLVEGTIENIYTTSEKEEYLRMDDGTTVRLDRIRELRSNEIAA